MHHTRPARALSLPRGGMITGVKPSPWPAVLLVVSVLVCVTVLAALHIDLGSLESILPLVVLPVLGVLLAQIHAVRHQTNGTTSALIEQNRELTKALRDSVPAPALEPLLAGKPEDEG